MFSRRAKEVTSQQIRFANRETTTFVARLSVHTHAFIMLVFCFATAIVESPQQETVMKLSTLHTVLILLANAYMEVACPDMEAPEMRRHWLIRRTVDFRHVVWC